MFEMLKSLRNLNHKIKNINFETCVQMLSLYNANQIKRSYFKYIDDFKKASAKKEMIDFEIDLDLLEELYKNINPHYNKKERILYLYFKLCFLLEMDDAYRFAHQIDEETLERYFAKSPKRLEKINLRNNKVTCFEFTEIMNKLVRMEGGIHKSYECYGSSDHVVCESIIDDNYFQFDSMPGISDLIMVKLNKGFFGITTNCESDIKRVVPEIQKVYNDVQKEFLYRKEEKKFSNYTLNKFTSFIDMINIGKSEKELLKEYIIKINDINLSKFEFCDEVAREYSSEIYTLSNKKIDLKRVCYANPFGDYGFCMILSVKQDDGTMIYFKFGDYDNLEVLSKEHLIDLIKENRIIITKRCIIGPWRRRSNIYRFIPGISKELQEDMNKQAAIDLVPLVLKGVLEDSINNKPYLLRK